MPWNASLGSVERFQHFCVPTVYAALLGISKTEAAERLLPIAAKRFGYVKTVDWEERLARMGGKSLPTRRPDAHERFAKRQARFEAKVQEWKRGERTNYPRPPQAVAHHFYTVAEFLKLHPQGTIVLGTWTHALLARDGEVVADTKRSKTMRGRVVSAFLMPEDLSKWR